MSKQNINIGASANDGTGDTIRTAFGKVNDNFTEVYDAINVANSVETDTSPSLGGDLDVSGFSIVANTGTGIISIVPSTSAYVRVDDITIDGTVVGTRLANTNMSLTPNGTGRVLSDKIQFTGGTINGVIIGGSVPTSATFTSVTVNNGLSATNGNIDNITIGGTTRAPAYFTAATASSVNADLINMFGNIVPNTTATYTLGTAVKKWSNGYFDNFDVNTLLVNTGVTAPTFTGALVGNASTATKWQTARTITLAGDLTGSVSVDGSADVTLTATVSGNTVALGTDTTGNYVTSITNGSYIIGADGGSESAALTLAVDATSANTASKVVARDASGNFSAGTITATLTGNVTGNVTGNASGTAATVTGAAQSAITSVGTLTGLTVSGTSNLGDVTVAATKTLDFGANKLTNIAAPAANTDASTKKYVDDAISNLVNGAGPALDTLKELGTALGDDAGFASTVTTALTNKQPIDGDLTAIAGIADGSIGWLKKTSSNNWAVSTTIPYTDLSGAPTAIPTQTSNGGKYLTTDGTSMSWGTVTADVVGPSSATDNAVTRFDSTTGKLLQNSLVTISDTGLITAPSVGNIIPFYYANQAAFPSASIYHGALAHSHADGKVYFAHGGVWNALANASEIVTEIPAQSGNSGKYLTTDGSSVSWATVSSGDVVGPASATDNAVARFDSTTGKLLQNSSVTISDTGDIDIPSGRANVTGTASTVGGGATVGVRSILAIDSAFGSNDVNDPASAQAIRGRVTGSNLTKTRNYVAGVTGQYLVTGTNASEFINTGLLGVVGNQTTTANAAVVAYLDGDGGLTTAGSAYGVSMKNSTPGSGFDYGLDLQFIDLNIAGTTAPFKQADIRFNNGVELVANVANTISLDADLTVAGITLSAGGDIVDSTGTSVLVPAQSGNSGKFLTTDGTSASWGAATEAPFSIKTADFSAAAGGRYGVNTTSVAVTATLPSSPATGIAIWFGDAGGAYATNNLTIGRNGNTIMGSSSDLTVSTNNESFGLFYNGTTWRLY